MHPIVIFEGQVLDGWHRWRACRDLQIEPITTQFEGDDPVQYVLASNLHRRHLGESQRAAAIVRCNEWKPAHREKEVCTGAELIETVRQTKSAAKMAEEAKVSVRTINNAKAGVKAGLGEEMLTGKITAKAAANLAKKAPDLAREVAEGKRDGINSALVRTSF